MSRLAAALVAAMLLVPRSAQMKEDHQARAGFIANRMNPGDPARRIGVAGFHDWPAAAAFAAGSPGADAPVFQQTIPLGESVRFAEAALPGQAAVLVVYTEDDAGQRTPLTLTLAHADLALAIGSCGYQLLVGLDRGEPTPVTSAGTIR